MTLFACSAFAHLLQLASAIPQLLVPPSHLSVASNFRLVAHVKNAMDHSPSLGFEGAYVISPADDACSEIVASLSLSDVDVATFCLDPKTVAIYNVGSGAGLRWDTESAATLTRMHHTCEDQAPHLTIKATNMGAVLSTTRSGQFVACLEDSSATADTRLFYQEETSSMPPNCAVVDLYALCVDGPDHGTDSVAVCCPVLENGACLARHAGALNKRWYQIPMRASNLSFLSQRIWNNFRAHSKIDGNSYPTGG